MIRSKISSAKNAMIGPRTCSTPMANDKKAAQVYLELERRLRAANAMDFDDLLCARSSCCAPVPRCSIIPRALPLH